MNRFDNGVFCGIHMYSIFLLKHSQPGWHVEEILICGRVHLFQNGGPVLGSSTQSAEQNTQLTAPPHSSCGLKRDKLGKIIRNSYL